MFAQKRDIASMKKKQQNPSDLSDDPVYLAAEAVNSLIRSLPSGTAYLVGVILIVMMTGRLAATKGSLASAVFPLVVQLQWGWHRVERVLERGKVSLDGMFDRLVEWCLGNLPVEVVRIGVERREVQAVDSSTIARLRCRKGLAGMGKGYCHRVQRAVTANIVAVVTSVVVVCGTRLGLVRRVRFGTTCAGAVEAVLAAAPKPTGKRLFVVDAGIATSQQFAQATQRDALLGRLRVNCVVWGPPPPPTGRRGRPHKFGPVLHPGRDEPEWGPDEEYGVVDQDGNGIRVRCWHELIDREGGGTRLQVVRIDDPQFRRPLIIGTTARELTSEEMRAGYRSRWPVETNFYVAQDTTAMEMPRAWTQTATERRIGLALLTGSLLQAIAAGCPLIPNGPWDTKPSPSAGRLARYLNLYIGNFRGLALRGNPPRNYRKIQTDCNFNQLDLELTG